MSEQLKLLLPAGLYFPVPQSKHPSVAVVASSLDAYVPAGHVLSEQLVAVPPKEKVPLTHRRQSVGVVALVNEPLNPAGQLMGRQDVELPPRLYSPAPHGTQPSF